jgi:toxin ParE1/3/4
MQLVISRVAEDDLESIADYIAADNPRRALSFLQELRAHCSRITGAPLAWPARPELGSGIRSSAFGRYVIFFRIDDNMLLIVRVLHGARDMAVVFEGPSV